MKENIFAKLCTELKDVAKEFVGTDQLRSRVQITLRKYITVGAEKETRSLHGLELEKALNFMKNHACSENFQLRSYSVKSSYGTGIGVTSKVTCKCCGKKKDVTDGGMW